MQDTIHSRILYAENNGDDCFMMSTLLGFSNIEVKAVNTTDEALKLAQSEYFDLYMLDNRFPGSDGLELCRRIRDFNSHTPIMFYSGDAYESDRQKGIAAGANAYIAKPQIEDIIPTILQLVEQTGSNATLSVCA
jgi:CheY-like chemotaxis protein